MLWDSSGRCGLVLCISTQHNTNKEKKHTFYADAGFVRDSSWLQCVDALLVCLCAVLPGLSLMLLTLSQFTSVVHLSIAVVF